MGRCEHAQLIQADDSPSARHGYRAFAERARDCCADDDRLHGATRRGRAVERSKTALFALTADASVYSARNLHIVC